MTKAGSQWRLLRVVSSRFNLIYLLLVLFLFSPARMYSSSLDMEVPTAFFYFLISHANLHSAGQYRFLLRDFLNMCYPFTRHNSLLPICGNAVQGKKKDCIQQAAMLACKMLHAYVLNLTSSLQPTHLL